MNWGVRYTKTFLKELARLPKNVRGRAEAIVFGGEIKEDPYLNGKTQKLSGFKSFYKIRIGDYRIGLLIDEDNQIIEFQRILHRREIYRKFP
jgi:mRNA interferase RelE/StbE